MGAIISECGQYRYRLERREGAIGPTVAFFGINPSTADAAAEDATTRKLHGFCRVNGFGKYIVGNVFAFRSTDVKALGQTPDPFGPENSKNLSSIIAAADVLMPCWGDMLKVPPHIRRRIPWLATLILESGKPVKVFGWTKHGHPKHPLMLGYDTKIVDWSKP